MNARSQQLFDRVRDYRFDFAVCVTDAELDPPGPRILFVNEQFEKLTGYPAAEALGKTPRMLQGPKTDRPLLARLKHTLRTGGFFQGQTTNYRKDGSEFLMAWSVSGVGVSGDEGPAFFLAVQHDAGRIAVPEMMNEVFRCHLTVLGEIDPSLETVQLLREPVGYANSIVDTVRTPMLVLGPDLCVRRANRQFYSLFQAGEGETIGRSLFALGGGQWDVPELRHLLDELLPKSNPFEGFEVRAAFPGIGPRVMHLSARQLPLAGPRSLILLAFEDVTERRKYEAELLNRANLFVAMLAHELRNPLAPILNALEVMRQADPESPPFRRAMETVERQVRQSTRLIEDLLDVSRVTRGKIDLRRERVELRGLVEQAIESVRPVMEANQHDFRVTLPWKPVWLLGDPTRLLQVVANLLQNAAKYTPPGGRVNLEVTADPDARRLTLRVADTGVGIEPEMLPKVFDLFMQEDRSLNRSGGGLGIGLTLVKNLVEMHGGVATARSDGKGRGAAFTVVFPYQPTDGGANAAPAIPAPGAAGRLRVVVIDDNADAADTTAMLLEAWGHEVFTAYDGTAGLDLIRARKPDAAIVDIGLPGLNGYEVAQRLKDAGDGPGVMIAVSGYGDESDVQRALWSGFHHHRVKPARPDDLMRLLTNAARAKQAGVAAETERQ